MLSLPSDFAFRSLEGSFLPACNNYGRYGNVECTAHTIEERDLFNAVLADINRFADMAVLSSKGLML